MLEGLIAWTYDFMLRYGYLALFLMLAFEGTGMPGPIQVAFMAAGYMISRGLMDFRVVVLICTLGNLLGNAIGYHVGAFGGRRFLVGYRGLRILEEWFARYGFFTVFVARIFGTIRTPTILGAGVARMNLGKFLFFSALGDFLWSVFWTYTGVFFAPLLASFLVSKGVLAYTGWFLSLVLLLVSMWWLRTRSKS